MLLLDFVYFTFVLLIDTLDNQFISILSFCQKKKVFYRYVVAVIIYIVLIGHSYQKVTFVQI